MYCPEGSGVYLRCFVDVPMPLSVLGVLSERFEVYLRCFADVQEPLSVFCVLS